MYSMVNGIDTYKDSGVEWSGKIPQDWKVNKIGSIYDERRTKVSDNEYQPLSVTKNGILPQLENVAKSDDSDNRKLVKSGDFVINSRSDRRGSCGIAHQDGSVSLINSVLQPKSNMDNRYYNFVFKSENFADEFYRWGHGIVDDLWTTKWTDMKSIYIPYPSIKEQQAIADYLDKKCGEIDKVVETEKAVIEKLKEYKQSIITEAVTKGLDKSVPLKDSGIEWIGKIPAHWEVKRTKFAADSFDKGNGITKEDVLSDGDIQCIRYGEIYSKYDKQCSKTVSATNVNMIDSPKYISKGDILFAGTGELIEEIGKNIVYTGNDPCLAGGDIIILKHKQNHIFLNYVLNSHYAQSQKSYGKVKLKVVHISASAIGNVKIALPSLEEQQQIANYLDKKCSEIDQAITHKEQVIEKFTEYKKSLIYECVTGKKEMA